MRYAEARNSIQTGDLIAVRRRSGFLPVATRLITRSDYTHTGIAVWEHDRLLLAQINGGGCNFIPLSQLDATDFDVFDCPVADREKVSSSAWLLLGAKIGYDIADLLMIAAHLLFRTPLPEDDGDGKICSTLSVEIYELAEPNWKPSGLPSLAWPGAVVAALGCAPKLIVRP